MYKMTEENYKTLINKTKELSKWKDSLHSWMKVKRLVAQSCSTLCKPMDCSPPDSSVHGILQAQILEWVAMPSSRGSSQPRDQTQVSHISGRFFTVWAPRESHEYWSGTLSLLWKIFLTRESNRGLLHCRRILYHLSYQRSDGILFSAKKRNELSVHEKTWRKLQYMLLSESNQSEI